MVCAPRVYLQSREAVEFNDRLRFHVIPNIKGLAVVVAQMHCLAKSLKRWSWTCFMQHSILDVASGCAIEVICKRDLVSVARGFALEFKICERILRRRSDSVPVSTAFQRWWKVQTVNTKNFFDACCCQMMVVYMSQFRSARESSLHVGADCIVFRTLPNCGTINKIAFCRNVVSCPPNSWCMLQDCGRSLYKLPFSCAYSMIGPYGSTTKYLSSLDNFCTPDHCVHWCLSQARF